ncbi:MAG: FmdE family protein [Pseudomonadota bacterium]
MSAQTILDTELFKKCLDFHGHLCPGLSLGYQAAVAGMDRLSENRSMDEEIVAIVETDACCSDAVQVITGCTFGKGNFIYRDYGKMAFTFVSRQTGKGVRVARKHNPDAVVDNRHQELMALLRSGKATQTDRSEFKLLHEAKSMEILDQSPETLFEIREVTIPMPSRARIEPSVQCDKCKEPTMASKLEHMDGQSFCGGCLAEQNIINN